MPRLPRPGSDAGQWGQILNDFLAQTHTSDGSLKPGIVDSGALAPNAVDETSLGATGGMDGQVLVKSTSSSKGLAWATPATITVNDAGATTKGIVQLSGDLGGTASSPTVPGLAEKADSTAVYTKAEVNSSLSTKADTSSLSSYVPIAQIGEASGVAALDSDGDVIDTSGRKIKDASVSIPHNPSAPVIAAMPEGTLYTTS